MATQVRGAARKAQLLDQLVELLLAEGFAHLTLDELATRLRCSKSTLYGLADSKEQLVRAATVHFFRRATERPLRRAAEEVHDGRPDQLFLAPRQRVERALGAAEPGGELVEGERR